MSSSREDSPDWLRCFQAPTHSPLKLSSDSDSLPNSRDESLSTERDNVPSEIGLKRGSIGDEIPAKKKRKKKKQGDAAATSENYTASHAADHSVWVLSSDSESYHDDSSMRETQNSQVEESVKDKDAAVVGNRVEPSSKEAMKKKSPKKLLKVDGDTLKKEKNKNDTALKNEDNGDIEVTDGHEKHSGPRVSTSSLPLLLSEKVNRSKVLVECEGDSIDLSGDLGAVGRVVIPNMSSGNHEMYLDLKGTIYRTTIVPSRTFCIVSFGESEAKIEAIMNDFVQLEPQSNVYEAETMVEGTLEGFSFDSEDEADKMPKAISHQTDQNEGDEEQNNGRTKGKAAKFSGKVQKKGNNGGKPLAKKRARKKAQVPKKAKK